MSANNSDLQDIFNQFSTYGELISYQGFGAGHINNTYVSIRSQAGNTIQYTHQQINQSVFKNPAHVIHNIHNVTSHIYKKIAKKELNPLIPPSRQVLQLIPTKTGSLYYVDKNNNYWRTYFFIENARTYESMNSTERAKKTGRAVGTFQKQLADYSGEPLYETIPNFHNMKWRYEQLDQACKNNKAHRINHVETELRFLLQNRDRGMILTEGLQNGKLKTGITHNDTKLNNILFDIDTDEAICMIDLDTVMHGTPLFDTGDLIRTATMTAEEDEKNLDIVNFDFTLFKSLITGYLEISAPILTSYEKSLIAESGRIFAQIMAVRFLTDYLNGDIYYKTNYADHNYHRCCTQIKLMQSMDKQWDTIQKFIKTLLY